MAGHQEGALRGWAKRLGVTHEQLHERIREGFSWCYMCRDWLPVDAFGLDNSRWDKLKSACRECCRLKHLAWRHGISVSEARQLKAVSVCAICGRADQAFEVDHDHSTGAVRGVLCSRCNTGLGQFCDDIELMKKAIAYLEEAALCKTP